MAPTDHPMNSPSSASVQSAIESTNPLWHSVMCMNKVTLAAMFALLTPLIAARPAGFKGDTTMHSVLCSPLKGTSSVVYQGQRIIEITDVVHTAAVRLKSALPHISQPSSPGVTASAPPGIYVLKFASADREYYESTGMIEVVNGRTGRVLAQGGIALNKSHTEAYPLLAGFGPSAKLKDAAWVTADIESVVLPWLIQSGACVEVYCLTIESSKVTLLETRRTLPELSSPVSEHIQVALVNGTGAVSRPWGTAAFTEKDGVTHVTVEPASTSATNLLGLSDMVIPYLWMDRSRLF